MPELVHPGAGPFSLIDRYACSADPAKRLDVLAVDAQIAEADKRGVSATENARRAALKILRRALKDGVDLRDVALYHLVTIAREFVPLSMSMAAAELQKTGLERHDAAVIAVVLADQDSASSAMGLRKVHNLLASAQLSEARQAALSLPENFPHRERRDQGGEGGAGAPGRAAGGGSGRPWPSRMRSGPRRCCARRR